MPKSIIKPLFVGCDLSAGGAERALLSVLRHLDRSQFRPTLFLLKSQGAFMNQIPAHVNTISALNEGRLRNSICAVIAKLVSEARKHDVVIGSLELTPTYLSWLAGTLAGTPAVGWVHTDLNEYLAMSSKWHVLAARFVYPRLEDVAFVSQGAKDAAIKRLGRTVHGQTIYNAFDSSSYPCPAPVEGPIQTRRDPTILAIGRLIPSKGFDVLIRAHASLLREGFCQRLVILGDGPAHADIDNLVEKLSLRETVSLMGFVSDTFSYLRSATVLVSTSRFEGFSMAILEALAAGVPVVSTDCAGGGPSEILDHGRYGLLVPVNDDAALAAAIKRVLSDRDLRSRLSTSGILRARQFSPEVAAAQWEKLLIAACEREVVRPS